LTESKIESAETKVTAEALFAQNEDLRKQLSIQQESLKTLTASLRNRTPKRKCFDASSRIGIANGGVRTCVGEQDRAKLEQRLLAAVSDLRLAQKERDQLRDQLRGLKRSAPAIFTDGPGRRRAGAG